MGNKIQKYIMEIIEIIKNQPEVYIPLLGTVSATIIGWIVIYLLNLREQRRNLRNKVKLQVYEELSNAKKDLGESRVDLGLSLSSYSLPFLRMKWAERERQNGNQAEIPNIIFTNHTRKLSEEIHQFSLSYRKMWERTDTWLGVIPELKLAYRTLISELNALSDRLSEHQSYLQNLPIDEHDWTEWNKEEIKSKADEAQKDFDRTTAYIDDFMTLAHNELLRPILGQEKSLRENFNIQEKQTFTVLTKKGLKQKVFYPEDSIWNMKGNWKTLIKRKFQSVFSRFLPNQWF